MKIQCIVLVILVGALIYEPADAQKRPKWIAPEFANAFLNPFKGDANAALEGKKTFTSMCVVCHGDNGKGNGIASVTLEQHPANFLSIDVRNESDGAIFWKMTEGRPPMASYKGMLTDQQRWQLVCYIRKLEEKK